VDDSRLPPPMRRGTSNQQPNKLEHRDQPSWKRAPAEASTPMRNCDELVGFNFDYCAGRCIGFPFR
jgi:hypothetical protein